MNTCQLCRMQPINPIMLICSHSLCLKCGENIQLQEHTSQIQNKFRIQCPKCRKLTHTYEIRNLLLESNELNLITDSSELDREILNESQLCHHKQQDILSRRKSNAYQVSTPLQKELFKKVVGSEKISPSRPKNLYTEKHSKASLNTSANRQLDMPKNTNTPSGTPQAQTIEVEKKTQTPQLTLVKQYSIQQKQDLGKLFYNDKSQTPKYEEQAKENTFQKDAQERHKRSATGIPEVDQASSDIVKQFFKMVNKNIVKLEQDLIIAVQKVDPQTLYSRLKILSSKTTDSEGELVQSIKVIQKLQQELQQMTTPQSYHRKTSSHTNNRYTNKTHEKSENNTSQYSDMRMYKKFL